MNTVTFFSAQQQDTATHLPTVSERTGPRLIGTVGEPTNRLSDSAYSEESLTRPSLSDEQREAAIQRAARSIEHHMAERMKFLKDFDITNNFADKGDADRHRLMAEEAARLMAELIRGRSEAQVARMLAAQAERMALEPGATRD